MSGSEGPYIEMDGPGLWVPRTVPYLEARRVAKSVLDWGERLRYVGKVDAEMVGFVRDCRCDEVCELAGRCRVCHEAEYLCVCETSDPEDWDICRAPAWAFERVES